MNTCAFANTIKSAFRSAPANSVRLRPENGRTRSERNKRLWRSALTKTGFVVIELNPEAYQQRNRTKAGLIRFAQTIKFAWSDSRI